MTAAKYPLHRSVRYLYEKLKPVVESFEGAEVSMQEALSSQSGGLDYKFHDIPAAFRELERQGKIKILEDGDRFRPTADFGILPQYVTGPLPAALAELLDRHRQDATEQTGDYATLYVAENGLRDLIARVLSAQQSDWWPLVPRAPRERAEENFEVERRGPFGDRTKTWEGLSPRQRLEYIAFEALKDIPKSNENWKLFKPRIGDVEIFRAKLAEAGPARNALAHTRPLTARQRTQLELCASYIAGLAKAEVGREPAGRQQAKRTTKAKKPKTAKKAKRPKGTK